MRCLLLCLLLTLEVAATRVFHQPLEEVLTQATPVIRARVRQSRVEITPDQLWVHIDLEEVEVVHLHGPPGTRVVHTFSTMLERDGMRVSPIHSGSGIEQSLQAGQEYFFLLDASGGYVLRVEPLSSQARILQCLKRTT